MAVLAAGVGLPAVSDLLIRALTHSSFAHERPPAGHNETLAFLGDAVLGLAVTDLLVQALTHPSFAHEHPPAEHNETLAFLGDAVVGLAVADLLVRQAPGAGPGTLTVRRAEIVSTEGLAAWARLLGVGACLRLGRGEDQHGGREKDSVLASAFEAVAGVLYLAGGLPAVLRLVERLLTDEVARPEADETP